MAVKVARAHEATSEPTTPRAPKRARRGTGLRGRYRGGGLSTLLLALPVILVFGLFSWWPIIASIPMSIQKNDLVQPASYVGWANFRAVLSDPLLPTAIQNTVWFTLLAVVIGFPVPILLATYAAELRRGRGLVSALAYLPGVIPPVVSVLLWKQFYDPDGSGLFNTVLGWFSIPPQPFLQNAISAMPSIVVQATWAGFGSTTIIYLAALMSIRSDLYDAAELDGAGIVQRAWHVTLPQIRHIILLMLLLQIIGTLQVFTEPYLMTGGGPANATVTVLMLVYDYAFVYGNYGQATALSLLLAIALGVVSIVYYRVTRRWSSS